nr:ABC transporter permease [Anaerolineae bacterium]
TDESAAIAAFLAEQGASVMDSVDDAGFARGQATVLATVSTAQEQTVAQAVGQVFPRSMVLTQMSVTAEMNRLFLNLLGFALAMAGLALLAGVMLVANVVSLAMIERRYEVGVMKAVGYTRRHVLTVIGLEYGLIGLVAGLLGAVGVQIMVTLISTVEAAAQGVLVMHPLTALLIIGLGIGLTVITALASAWGPTQVRPLVVLGDRPA